MGNRMLFLFRPPPARPLSDLLKHPNGLLLLGAVRQSLCGVSKRADGIGGDAAVFDVGCYATNHLAVAVLHIGHFGVVGRAIIRIDLNQKQLGCVVEEARDDCAPLHEPHFTSHTSGKADL